MLAWCDRHNVGYIMGLAKNSRILQAAGTALEKAQEQYRRSGRKVHRFTSVKYSALSWDRPRRVIVKAECSEKGLKPRFVVTNLKGPAGYLPIFLSFDKGQEKGVTF